MKVQACNFNPFIFFVGNQCLIALDDLQQLDADTCLSGLPSFYNSYPKSIDTSIEKEDIQSFDAQLDEISKQEENQVLYEDQAFAFFLQLKMQILLLKLFPLSDEEIKAAKAKAKDKLAKLDCLFDELESTTPAFWSVYHMVIPEIGKQLLSFFEIVGEDQVLINSIIKKHEPGLAQI
jgi:hypothetical protein